MKRDELVTELKTAIERQLGTRVGTFKVPAVDETLSRARQHARALLTDDQRGEIDIALVEFREWVIARDPEALERVRGGGHAPQDIDVAVRVAEDCAIALVVEDLDAEQVQILTGRVSVLSVETIEERTIAARPKLTMSDGNVKLMMAGIAIVFVGASLTTVAGFAALGASMLGAAVFVAGVRRWRGGEVTSNVAPSHVLKAGVMGRNRKRSL